jgi:type IV pilus assembly protein PilQ
MRFPVQVTQDNTVTIRFYDAALELTATPQITYDGNIFLDLDVSNNRADFTMSVGGIPTIRTSEVSTRVLVSDGGTTILGVIIVEDEGSTEDRVPGLGSLPILGHLFRRNATLRDNREIMFIVTPRIVR